MKLPKRVFCLVHIKYYNQEISVDPIGIYSELEIAMDYLNDLEELMTNNSDEDFFDVITYKINTKPDLIEALEEQKKKQDEIIENAIIRLMQKGDVEQLIGEDGEFYYKLSDIGKKKSETVTEKLEKFLKSRKKKDNK